MSSADARSGRKPVARAAPQINPADPVSEAGRAVLTLHVRQMQRAAPGARRGKDSEALHDMRVAVRRMREALRIFGSHYRRKLRKWMRRELAQLGRALGDVRDLDVLIQHAEAYHASLPPERRAELEPLLVHWARRRRKARRRMESYLESRRYRDFIARFEKFCKTPLLGVVEQSGGEPMPLLVSQAAPILLDQHYEAIRAYEPVLDGAPVATLHALRIDVKRARYALEFFQDVLGAEAGDLIALMIRLQEHLGALHDADVASHLIGEFLHRRARRAAPPLSDAAPARSPDAIADYLDCRTHEVEQRIATLATVWQPVVSLDTREKLARAVSVL